MCLIAGHIISITSNLVTGHLGVVKNVKEENESFIIPIIQKQPLLTFWCISFQIYSLRIFRHHNSKGVNMVTTAVINVNFTSLSSLQHVRVWALFNTAPCYFGLARRHSYGLITSMSFTLPSPAKPLGWQLFSCLDVTAWSFWCSAPIQESTESQFRTESISITKEIPRDSGAWSQALPSLRRLSQPSERCLRNKGRNWRIFTVIPHVFTLVWPIQKRRQQVCTTYEALSIPVPPSPLYLHSSTILPVQ